MNPARTQQLTRLFAASLLCLAASGAQAQVQVIDPWVRATVPQQTATGAFMTISSSVDARLISANSPMAGVVELHEMSMDGNVMRMRAVPGIELPAGKSVELQPGGYHMMLMKLGKQMTVGDAVPITLVVENKDGKRQTIDVNAPVRPLSASGGMGDMRAPQASRPSR